MEYIWKHFWVYLLPYLIKTHTYTENHILKSHMNYISIYWSSHKDSELREVTKLL